MTRPRPALDDLVTCLSEWLVHTTTIWKQYQQHGPGRVRSDLFDPVDSTANRLKPLLHQLAAVDSLQTGGVDLVEIGATIRLTTELARRCACTPQGLCFISGEAGLIPRKDQHDVIESALQRLSRCVRQLRDGRSPAEQS